jgi:flagellin
VGNTISNAAGDSITLPPSTVGGTAASFSGYNASKVVSMTAAASGSVFAGKSGAVNITATAATKTTQPGSTIYAASTDHIHADTTLSLNGHAIGSFTAAANTVDDVINAINAQQGVTGLSASFVTDHIQLTSTVYGFTGINGTDTGIAIGWGGTETFGVNAAITAMSVGGVALTAGQLATFSIRNGNTVSNAAGDSIVLAAGSTGGNGVATLTGGATPGGGTGVASLNGSALGFQIGANAGEQAALSIASTAAANLGTGVTGNSFSDLSKVDVTTNASDAIKVIDAAIAQLSAQRASLGAFQQNVLQSNINSLNVTNENITASESSVRDTDMAAEMTNFTRLNILSQAGIAMLTQANQQPQQMLSLLKG